MVTDRAASSVTPVFIISGPRTGSTLLRYIVDTHTEICCPAEIFIGELANSLCLAYYYTLGQTMTAADEAEKKRSAVAEVRRVILDMMNSYAAAKNKARWCEKSPSNLDHLELLNQVFPDAKFICLHRHCMDVVHSLIECSRWGFMDLVVNYAYKYPGNLAAAMAESWLDRTSKQLKFEGENPERCLRIKYESIVLDPGVSLPQLFTFLGLSWQPEILDRIFSTPHDLGLGDLKTSYSKNIYKNAVGKGSTIRPERIPGEMLERINHLLTELEYPLVGPDWGSTPPQYLQSDLAEAEEQLPSSVKEIFTSRLPERLKQHADSLKHIKGIYKFIITGSMGGVWLMNLTDGAGNIIASDGSANCTITLSATDLIDIVNGSLNPAEAFLQGRLNVAGDPSLASQIASVLFVG
jgi:hypothetical protein